MGTCQVPGASATGDTYLRMSLEILWNKFPVAANDDSCGGRASFIQYTAPGAGKYALSAGCFGSGSCGGTLAYRITSTAP